MLMLTHINADNTYSVTDSNTGELGHFKLEEINFPVLGIFRNNNGDITDIHTVQADSVSLCLVPMVNNIEEPDLREFANCIRRIIPKYIFEVPAASTNKHHPASSLGNGGLARHLQSVCRFLEYILELDCYQIQFNVRERDCMRIACLMHDFLKSGWQEDFEKNKYSKFTHPLLAANAIRGMKGLMDDKTLEFIAHCIESHMGQWNTHKDYPNIVLPLPSDEYQRIVHLADYLSSRRELSMAYENNHVVYVFDNQEVINIEDVTKSVNRKPAEKSADNQTLKQDYVKPQKKVLSPNDKIALEKVVDRVSKGEPIDLKKAAELGITCEDGASLPDKIMGVWDNILRYGNVSEKQSKYLVLAIGDTTSNEVVVEKPKTYTELDDKKTNMVKALLQFIRTANPVVPDDLKKKYDIVADNEKICSIFETVLSYRRYTEKQAKYLNMVAELYRTTTGA